MKKLIIAMSLTMAATMSFGQLKKPFTKGGFETGKYRNVFLEAGYSQKEIDKKVDEVFNEVFFSKDKHVYFEVNDTMAYISDVKNNDARTEGMSYGMMVAVQMNRKDIFDKLWRWAKHYMQHQDGPLAGYFAWSCKTDGTRNAQGPASDGELYFVTSLIFASNLWGNDTGINYKAEAQKILNLSESKTGKVDGARPMMRPQPGQQPDPEAMKRFQEMNQAVTPLIDRETRLLTLFRRDSAAVTPTPLTTFLHFTRFGQNGQTTVAQNIGRVAPTAAVHFSTNVSTKKPVSTPTNAISTAQFKTARSRGANRLCTIRGVCL